MAPEDIEQILEGARFRHLSEATLVSYRDNQLDEIGLTLADVHLKLCLVCERRLTFLKEEAAALEGYTTTEKDRALIEESIRKQHPENIAGDFFHTEIQRLASYIDDLLDAWIVVFRQPAMRGAGDGDEVWSYQSEDGLLKAWAILERDASLTVHFSSPALTWEGARIRFRLGPFSTEVTLQRVGDSEVAAKIEIPRHQRAKKMKDIEIEVLEGH
jgi:hypothetical protein